MVGGIAIVRDGELIHTSVEVTKVHFRAVDASFVDWYVATGEWRGRAGGYAIQGAGAALIAGIEGDYLNVVGLPLARLLDVVPELLPRRREAHRSGAPARLKHAPRATRRSGGLAQTRNRFRAWLTEPRDARECAFAAISAHRPLGRLRIGSVSPIKRRSGPLTHGILLVPHRVRRP